MAETAKAHARRLREGWFDRYAPEHLPGIDIGCGSDPLNATFDRWDKADGDATDMYGIPDGTYHTVYASHVLEHLDDPVTALRNWWRILAPGGCLIVCVPSMELYEKKRDLPSNWNGEHKTYWTPVDHGDAPHIRGLWRTCIEALVPVDPPEPVLVASEVVESVLNEGYHSYSDGTHSHGEFSFEIILRKPEAHP
jgi:SAM-dependent methyltransferase